MFPVFPTERRNCSSTEQATSLSPASKSDNKPKWQWHIDIKLIMVLKQASKSKASFDRSVLHLEVMANCSDQLLETSYLRL